jgi:flagellin
MSLVINHNMMAANTARNLNAHYARLGQSAQCLSTGLRVNAAADDAAGLAIRELQRADIATLQQGARNANDAVSMIQTADGALDVIDEKLIRMKELAEQAATGTYDATQRLLIDSEYQTMAAEINRIAKATDFNGIHLLDGSLSSPHDGSGLSASGAVKIHFGTGNSSAEDYYYLQLPSATIGGLGLGRSDTVPLISQQMENGASMAAFPSGIVSFAVIPAGTQNIQLHLYDHGANDTLQIFTRSGRHLAGTALGGGRLGQRGRRQRCRRRQPRAD